MYFPFITQNVCFSPKHLFFLSAQVHTMPVSSKYLYKKYHHGYPVCFYFYFGFPKLGHQHSLRTHDLVISHASSCNSSEDISLGGISCSLKELQNIIK